MQTNYKSKFRNRGVAMFLVLGGIVLFSLLGYAGLKLAEKDSSISGGLVDLKSQRLTAISGLNQAIARMENDPQNTVNQLKAFVDDPDNSWLDFNNSTKNVVVSNSATWFELGTDKSACKVRILGISPGSSNGLDIAFSALGRGRSGDQFEIKAVYHMRGIDYRLVWPTEGPTDGMLARGGLTNIDAGIEIDGGIYSGKPGIETRIQGNGATNFGKLRAAGDVNIRQSSGMAGPITISENSFIGGALKVEFGNSIARFNKNLVVKGGLLPIDGSLEVTESFYLRGTQIPNPINQSITVGNTFWVKDVYFPTEGPLTVGTSGLDNGLAIFDKGILIKGNTTNIYGSMHVGPVVDPTSTSHWIGLNSATVNISKDLNFWKDGTTAAGSVNFQRVTATIGGNTYFAEEISQLESGSLSIAGTSVLRDGIRDINFSGTDATLVFKGRTWIERHKQRKFKGIIEFRDQLSLNGAISRCFAGSGAYNPGSGTCTGDSNLWKTWKFDPAASNRSWSYTNDGMLVTNPDATTITNGTPTSRSNDELFSSLPSLMKLIRPTPATLTSLGYTARDTLLALADNPASEVLASNFPTAFFNNADWDLIYADYRIPCKLDGWDVTQGHARAPSASQLKCIYDKESAKGDQETGGRLWNGEYLVIHIDDLSKFKDIEVVSAGFSISDRVLPSSVKIFWILDVGMTVNGYWYSGEKGSIQIIDAKAALTDFGWTGNFYGFIQFEGAVTSLQTRGNSILYGAIEIKDGTQSIMQNASAGTLKVLRKDPAALEAFSDISGNFFASEGLRNGTGSTYSVKASGPILKFNGDKDKTDLTKENTMVLEDGWVQFERLGEFR